SDSRYRIDYRSDGTVASDQSPPSPALRNAAAADQMRGTVDQLTAFFIVERQLAQRGSCGLAVPVFDGLSRYNLRFTDAQPETLSPEGHQRFAGPTLVCGVRREDVVGFPGGQDANGGRYKKGKTWEAPPIGQDQMVPVRMEFDSEYGSVSGYLAELRHRGVNLSFQY